MDYIDISPGIRSSTPVFPGDQPFERQVTMDIGKGDHLALSWMKTTLHIGAHTDAPNHYHRDGASIDKRDLSLYMGACQVMDASHVGPRRIVPADVDLNTVKTSRILFKTKSFAHQNVFQRDFTSLSPELIAALGTRGVRLVGIDTPSVDPSDSKALESHQALFAHDLAVLEGIDLDKVEAGPYLLFALPLRLEGADASPVRAVLLPADFQFDWVISSST